jgi:hypothetical protein
MLLKTLLQGRRESHQQRRSGAVEVRGVTEENQHPSRSALTEAAFSFVEDGGLGMASNYFRELLAICTTKVPEMGLGLPIARSIIGAHESRRHS